MKFAILFEDDPAYADKRQQFMPNHLEFLAKNGALIRGAGPLKDGATPAGGLWVVDVDSFEQAKALTEEDPLFATGLRRRITILEWNQVFAHNEILLKLK